MLWKLTQVGFIKNNYIKTFTLIIYIETKQILKVDIKIHWKLFYNKNTLKIITGDYYQQVDAKYNKSSRF